MILPKTWDNCLKCILLCFHAEHQVQPCNMFTQNTCPMFFTKFYGNSTFMAIVWILVKNSGVVYGKNLNKKHGAKKLAMSTKQMQDIFSPIRIKCKVTLNIGVPEVGGKRIVACASESQKVNSFRGLRLVTWYCPTQKFAKSNTVFCRIIFLIQNH